MMSNAGGLGVVELIFLFLFQSGLGIPVGIPPAELDPTMLQMAPDECLLYTTWAATASASRDASSATEQLVSEPEIQAFLAEVSDRFTEAMDEAVESCAGRTRASNIAVGTRGDTATALPSNFALSCTDLRDPRRCKRRRGRSNCKTG